MWRMTVGFSKVIYIYIYMYIYIWVLHPHLRSEIGFVLVIAGHGWTVVVTISRERES